MLLAEPCVIWVGGNFPVISVCNRLAEHLHDGTLKGIKVHLRGQMVVVRVVGRRKDCDRVSFILPLKHH